MKQCPKCSRTYADETLNFCLEDGEWLVEEEPATALLRESPAFAEAEPPGSSRYLREKPSFSANRAAKPLAVIIFALIVIGGYFGYRSFGSGSKQIESIAVMPFVNESGNPDVEYLSDGMTESLINSLSTLPNLSVKARNTVFRYKGKEIDEKKVGQELSVQAVLLGRFIQRGDDLMLSLSLVDAGTGDALWGEQYDRKMQDLSVLRNDIARDVAQKLRTRLSNAETTKLTKNYTANAEALRLYFNGRHHWSKRTTESVRTSIGYFNQAIEKEPNFALAYSGLADAYAVPIINLPPKDAMPKAKAAAMRALELDDTLAEAHTSLARVLQVYEWNWASAEKEYKRALELDPRYPQAHQWYGGFLDVTGHAAEAIAERRIAIELDPLSGSANFELGLAYFFSRDYESAITQLNKALELEPGFPSALGVLIRSYAKKGQYDLAIAKIEEAQERNFPGTAGQVYALAGRKNDSLRMIGELERSSQQSYVSATTFALIYAALGDNGKTMEYLEQGYEERAFQMQFLKVDPWWDNIRSDPRFADLVRRVGLQ